MHSYSISKHLVYAAWLKVKAKGGAAGADNVSIEMFEQHEKDELYKLWNRMSSGSYMALLVKRVDIAKLDGKLRPLGTRLALMQYRYAKFTSRAIWNPQVSATLGYPSNEKIYEF